MVAFPHFRIMPGKILGLRSWTILVGIWTILVGIWTILVGIWTILVGIWTMCPKLCWWGLGDMRGPHGSPHRRATAPPA